MDLLNFGFFPFNCTFSQNISETFAAKGKKISRLQTKFQVLYGEEEAAALKMHLDLSQGFWHDNSKNLVDKGKLHWQAKNF